MRRRPVFDWLLADAGSRLYIAFGVLSGASFGAITLGACWLFGAPSIVSALISLSAAAIAALVFRAMFDPNWPDGEEDGRDVSPFDDTEMRDFQTTADTERAVTRHGRRLR